MKNLFLILTLVASAGIARANDNIPDGPTDDRFHSVSPMTNGPLGHREVEMIFVSDWPLLSKDSCAYAVRIDEDKLTREILFHINTGNVTISNVTYNGVPAMPLPPRGTTPKPGVLYGPVQLDGNNAGRPGFSGIEYIIIEPNSSIVGEWHWEDAAH